MVRLTMESEEALQKRADVLEASMVKAMNAILRGVGKSFGASLTAASESRWNAAVNRAETQWMQAVGGEFFPQVVDAFATAAERMHLQMIGLYEGPAEDVPFVPQEYALEYLRDTANRMVNVSEGTWARARAQLIQGFSAGESIEELSARLMQVSDWGERRAATVARTEIISASNAGALAEARAVSPDASKEWMATRDSRTREWHREADGETVLLDGTFTVGGQELDYPGDPSGRPDNIINCVVGSTRVDASLVKVVMRSWFDGEIIDIRTATGKTLSVTPNHPILTLSGWKSACDLEVGDDVICGDLRHGITARGDENRGPTEIAEIYRSASILGKSQCIGEAVADFHGERRHADIYVVTEDGLLGFDGETSTPEDLDKFTFAATDQARTVLGSLNHGIVPLSATGCVSDRSSTHCRIGCRGSGTPGDCVFPGHDDPVDFGLRKWRASGIPKDSVDHGTGCSESIGDRFDELSRIVTTQNLSNVNGGFEVSGFRSCTCDSETTEMPADGLPGDAKFSGYFDDGESLLVKTDRLVEIERRPFTGHVYNLATGGGWYTGNGITTSNCRCTLAFHVPRESVQRAVDEYAELPDVSDEFDPADFVDWDTLTAALERHGFVKKPFDESKHNRGKGGKFAPKSGGGGSDGKKKIDYKKPPKKISYVKPAKKAAPASPPVAPAKKAAAPPTAKKAAPAAPPPVPAVAPSPPPVAPAPEPPDTPAAPTPNSPLVEVTDEIISGMDTDSGQFAEVGSRVLMNDRLGTVRHTRTDESGLSGELFVQFDDNPTEVEQVDATEAETIDAADAEEVMDQPFDEDAVTNMPPDAGAPGAVAPSPQEDEEDIREPSRTPFPVSPGFETMSNDDAMDMQDDMTASRPWTVGQETALTDYTGDGYVDMNGCLRQGDNCTEDVEFDNRLMSQAMRPTTRATTAFRGANLSALGVGSREELFGLVGSTVTDPGFTSTSINPDIANTSGFRGAVRLQIEVPEGTSAAYVEGVTRNADEQELVLDQGTRFEVLEVVPSPDDPNQTNVRVRVIP